MTALALLFRSVVTYSVLNVPTLLTVIRRVSVNEIIIDLREVIEALTMLQSKLVSKVPLSLTSTACV